MPIDTPAGNPTEVRVAVLLGSASDLPIGEAALRIMQDLGIPAELRVCSAHRTPGDLHAYIPDAERRGCKVFIAVAGLAAHLAGVLASHTLCPVIGVPADGGPLQGMDALLATVQMPAGVPVACVALGRTGGRNAAWLAARILAVTDPALRQRLEEAREEMAADVRAAHTQVQETLRTRRT